MTGAISVASFGASPKLVSRSLTSNVPNTENALVQIDINPFGSLQTTEGSGGGVVTTRLPEWWGQPYLGTALGNGVAQGFEARLSVLSGSAPNAGSAVSSWLPFAAGALSWVLFRTTVGTSSGQWRLEIRSAASLQVLATATYTVNCTKNP